MNLLYTFMSWLNGLHMIFSGKKVPGEEQPNTWMIPSSHPQHVTVTVVEFAAKHDQVSCPSHLEHSHWHWPSRVPGNIWYTVYYACMCVCITGVQLRQSHVVENPKCPNCVNQIKGGEIHIMKLSNPQAETLCVPATQKNVYSKLGCISWYSHALVCSGKLNSIAMKNPPWKLMSFLWKNVELLQGW